MLTEVVKYRIWNLALRMDPQTAIYGQRIASTATAGQDSFTTWQLSRVVYRPATLDELKLVDATVSDQYGVWTICQVDLENALSQLPGEVADPAPTPLPTYELMINGALWIVERVNPRDMNQSFECLCVLGR